MAYSSVHELDGSSCDELRLALIVYRRTYGLESVSARWNVGE